MPFKCDLQRYTAALLRAAPPGSLAGEPMAMLASGLASEHVRACDHPAVRAQLLAAVVNAVSCGGAACKPHSRELFHGGALHVGIKLTHSP